MYVQMQGSTILVNVFSYAKNIGTHIDVSSRPLSEICRMYGFVVHLFEWTLFTASYVQKVSYSSIFLFSLSSVTDSENYLISPIGLQFPTNGQNNFAQSNTAHVHQNNQGIQARSIYCFGDMDVSVLCLSETIALICLLRGSVFIIKSKRDICHMYDLLLLFCNHFPFLMVHLNMQAKTEPCTKQQIFPASNSHVLIAQHVSIYFPKLYLNKITPLLNCQQMF